MSPKHNRVGYFLKQGFFNDVTSFAEFESRISRLPSPQDRGDAFEVFAQAYLATQKIVQTKQIWPFEEVPQSIKQRLSISGRDMGVDGVFETPLGEYNAYQVKFRTGRPALTWEELSTFMGLTDQVSQRVLFTNCDDLPAVMNNRSGFFCIRGSDLDRLGASDFQNILRWLETGNVLAVRKQPLPHQTEALQKILPALQQHDRATAVLACGTGKTLLALWVAERMGCKTVLVLVPSLALVRQTLHEWLKETSWPEFSFLCVCSDPTVAKDVDDLIVRQSDLDFPVTTDSATVRQWLVRPFSGVRIVFSTYQSAEVVAEGMDHSVPFDFGIFDEAHKTAGREGTRFSFALKDKNLPIHKRLFMTATPRHYDVRHKDKEGDARLVYSMDVPEVYGPVAHTLTFPEAARRDIICGYKVLISVVTSDMVTEHQLRHGEVVVDGDPVKARQVANQIAIEKAVEKYGVGRIFTFHRSVASAKSFVAPGGEGVGTHLPQFKAFHVNGAMRTAEREVLMHEFKEAANALMSNARCLTEGVDVPAVDMVAFMSPKKSRVDIVQATGRAMRKSPNKITGYVLVPVYLDQAKGESIEGAVARNDFSDLWDVLEAMQEQDDVLADVIRQMRKDRGRIRGFDDQRFRDKVEILGPTVSLDSLRSAITAECVEHLGITWDERYGQLVNFKERFGHCEVPIFWPENPKLGNWVGVQRRTKKQGKISDGRVSRLEALGFSWDPLDAKWEEMFQRLLVYRADFGNCNVPMGWSNDPELSIWVAHQRYQKRKKILGVCRTQRLDEVGFVWDPVEAAREEAFAKLVAYKQRFGDCNVPHEWGEDRRLAKWVQHQREYKKQGGLNADRIQQLDMMGFIWEPTEALWEEMFARLVAFSERIGHCNVPRTHEDEALSNWIGTQRVWKKRNKMPVDRIDRLNNIGFVWDPNQADWEENLGKLSDYKARFGHTNVPAVWSEDRLLGKWLRWLRTARKKNKLSIERIKQLEELGFDWAPFDRNWNDNVEKLRAFKRQYGHCRVPHRWPKDLALGPWVSRQRMLRMKNLLSMDRIKLLEDLGFEFDPYAASWDRMFRRLLEYRRRFGNCHIPQSWKEDRELAHWVANQRKQERLGKLDPERVQQLIEAGFKWSAGVRV